MMQCMALMCSKHAEFLIHSFAYPPVWINCKNQLEHVGDIILKRVTKREKYRIESESISIQLLNGPGLDFYQSTENWT